MFFSALSDSSVFVLISDSDAHDRYKRATNDLTSCPVIAVADYKFYQHMGQSNNFTTANYIVSIKFMVITILIL